MARILEQEQQEYGHFGSSPLIQGVPQTISQISFQKTFKEDVPEVQDNPSILQQFQVSKLLFGVMVFTNELKFKGSDLKL